MQSSTKGKKKTAKDSNDPAADAEMEIPAVRRKTVTLPGPGLDAKSKKKARGSPSASGMATANSAAAAMQQPTSVA